MRVSKRSRRYPLCSEGKRGCHGKSIYSHLQVRSRIGDSLVAAVGTISDFDRFISRFARSADGAHIAPGGLPSENNPAPQAIVGQERSHRDFCLSSRGGAISISGEPSTYFSSAMIKRLPSETSMDFTVLTDGVKLANARIRKELMRQLNENYIGTRLRACDDADQLACSTGGLPDVLVLLVRSLTRMGERWGVWRFSDWRVPPSKRLRQGTWEPRIRLLSRFCTWRCNLPL